MLIVVDGSEMLPALGFSLSLRPFHYKLGLWADGYVAKTKPGLLGTVILGVEDA